MCNQPTDRDVLFIDIDGTLTDSVYDAPSGPFNQSLLLLMRDYAVSEKGLGIQEAEAAIRDVYESQRWWHWSDFIRRLDLEPHRFWEHAYEHESRHIQPVSSDLAEVFDRLLDAGYKMFITSNNPSSGILLKLRIAGLGQIWGSRYFLQYLNPPALHCMKEEPEFWHRALAHTGLDPARITVIGDSLSDDVQAPRAAGYSSSIQIDVTRQGPIEREDGLCRVSNWQQIAELLLAQS